jgi:hypothetical protein
VLRARRAFLLPLLALVALPLAATEAGAAVPRRSFEYAMGCPEDNYGVKWWASRGRSAVQNDCRDRWVVITNYRAGHQTKVVSVAPGAHFNWSRKRLVLPTPYAENAEIEVSWGRIRCGDDGAKALAVYKGSHGKPVPLECPDDFPR